MKVFITTRIVSLFAALLIVCITATYVHAQNASAHETLGKIRSAMRPAKYENALKEVNIVLAKNPTNANAWCLKGEIQSRLKDATAALDLYNKAIQSNKASINGLVGKANALVELKKETESQKLLQQVISMMPSSAVDYLARGVAFRVLGQYDKALTDYDEALKRNPDIPEVQMNKGVVYWHKGDYSSAILYFTAAIKLDGNFVEALANRGAAYRKKGDINAAIADYSNAIQINPNDAMTFYNRGVAYQKRRLHDKAIEDFTSAIRLQPRYPEAYLNRGVAYTGINKIAEARQDFQKTAEQDPSGQAGQNAKRGLKMLKGH